MQEKQKLPLYLIARIWFLANCILAGLFVAFLLILYLINRNQFEGFAVYFGAIFIGFFLASPSLILLIVANDIYKLKRFLNITITRYLQYVIIIINLVYLIVTFLFININLDAFIFYIITTCSGLISHYFLTKNYTPENEF